MKGLAFDAEKAVKDGLVRRFPLDTHYIVEDMAEQHKDIDLRTITRKGVEKTYSVKMCNKMQDFNYRCNFEIKQHTLDYSRSMDGNFLHCEADVYVIVTTDFAFLFRFNELKDLVLNGNLGYKTTNHRSIDKAIAWAKQRGANLETAMIRTDTLNISLKDITNHIPFWVMPLDEEFTTKNKNTGGMRTWVPQEQYLKALNITPTKNQVI